MATKKCQAWRKKYRQEWRLLMKDLQTVKLMAQLEDCWFVFKDDLKRVVLIKFCDEPNRDWYYRSEQNVLNTIYYPFYKRIHPRTSFETFANKVNYLLTWADSLKPKFPNHYYGKEIRRRK